MNEEQILKSLGEIIRERRKELAYTQEEFAHIAGFERAYYGRVERGIQNVTILNLFKLSSALKCHPEELLEKIPR